VPEELGTRAEASEKPEEAIIVGIVKGMPPEECPDPKVGISPADNEALK
jgi:hypothetical protein